MSGPPRTSSRYGSWSRPARATLLPVSRDGMAGPVTASGLASGDRLGLSVEPAGGSPHPTSAMILMLVL